MLKKYVSNPSHILSQKLIELHEDLTYEDELVKTLDKQNKVLKKIKVRPLVKVLWKKIIC